MSGAINPPPLDNTVPVTVAGATRFLYQGANPVQTGVEPGTINSNQVAVLRGQVLTTDGAPLEGVRVLVLAHPEYGQTLTQANGEYALAINGGDSAVTLEFTAQGFLPSQRSAKTPWQTFLTLDDVRLVALDPVVTEVDLTSSTAIQVVRGSVVNDGDGERQATVFFPAGLSANLVLPGNVTVPQTTLHVRATEYTVGEHGPEAMPGTLPQNSAYTYAVELGVDEAIEAGATRVEFSAPVPFYVDNFLEFPVGGIVPLGYYDREKMRWISANNGRVIEIHSVADGMANLVVAEGGVVATPQELSLLGITDAERTALAQTYEPGRTLWRSPITHFTPWDCNWPYAPPLDATPPPDNDVGYYGPVEDPDCEGGSIIECQNQVLGETIPITGTPYSLNYRSSRQPGYDRSTVEVVATGATYSASLQDVVVVFEVAGQRVEMHPPVAPNQKVRFTWNGLDAWGRQLVGTQQLIARVGFKYPLVYSTPAQFAQSFGQLGGAPMTANRDTTTAVVWSLPIVTTVSKHLGPQDLGGWSLNAAHRVDPTAATLLLGDGTVMGPNNGSSALVKTVVPATDEVSLAMTPGPDTSIYVATYSSSRSCVYKMLPDGTRTVVAGCTFFASGLGDGGPAVEASLSYVRALATDAAGNLYLADTGIADGIGDDDVGNRIRKVDMVTGTITTVAGNGTNVADPSYSGPATGTALVAPTALAFGPLGDLFVGTKDYLVKITPAGNLSRITWTFGDPEPGYTSNSVPTPMSHFVMVQPAAMARDLQGRLLVALPAYGGDGNSYYLHRVDLQTGLVSYLAGNALGTTDPTTFNKTKINHIRALAVGQDGSIYVACAIGRIAILEPTGWARSLIGQFPGGSTEDGVPASLAFTGAVGGMAINSENQLFYGELYVRRIRTIPVEGVRLPDPLSAWSSPERGETYGFDENFRHVKTYDNVTGKVVLALEYNAQGQVVGLTDAFGARTSVEWSGNQPIAVVSPDNLRTQLALDGDGYLASVTNPAGESTLLSYGLGGLLTAFTRPNGNASTISYAPNGRLLKDENAAGGYWDLAVASTGPGNSTVTMTSATGLQRVFNTTQTRTTVNQTATEPDGSVWLQQSANAQLSQTLADGTTQALTWALDPRGPGAGRYLNKQTVTTPGGLAHTTTMTRTATGAADNSLKLLSAVDTTVINGRTHRSAWDGVTRTFTTTSAAGRVATRHFNEHNQLVDEQVGSLEPTTLAYDARGRVTSITRGTVGSGHERVTTLTYDSMGWLSVITDPLGDWVGLTADAAGRVTEQRLPGDRVVTYAYDANSNLTSLTPPGRTAHAFTYNAVDQTTGYAPPTAGLPSSATAYTFNLDKDLTRTTRADGVTVDFTRTGAQLTTVTPSVGSPVALGYSPTTQQLTTVESAGGTITYMYDGLLTRSESLVGEVTGSVGWVYNPDFRVTRVDVNTSNQESRTYDADGLLTNAGPMVLTRDPSHGFITATTLGSLGGTQTYNGLGEPEAYTLKHGTTPLYSLVLTRDLGGRITGKVETVLGTETDTVHTFNAAGQLAGVTVGGVEQATYAYDSNGNRTHENGAAVATFDAQDRLLSHGTTTYTYNPAGTLLTRTSGATTTDYTYDVFGNLTGVSTPALDVTYVVDGVHRRVGKKVDGTLVAGWLYENQVRIAAELDGANNLVSRFVYGEKPNVPELMKKGGQTYQLVTDQVGSVRLVVNASTGDVAQRLDYDAWGKVLNDTNPGFQPFGFAGGLYDPDTGLTRFGARDYDAEAGRWTAKDPRGFLGRDTNLYAYVLNNPVTFMDPNGELVAAIGGRIALGLAGAAARQAVQNAIRQGGIPAAIGACLGLGICMLDESDDGEEGEESGDDDIKYPDNPDNKPEDFTPIKGSRGKQCKGDGSVWERDTSSHGGEQWKRWKDKKSWEKGKTPNSVWPDGRVRK